ncbi:Type II secretion system protein G precursor [Phycisphaerae bacterium RAS1]|nr:Type II secretion system protein G precursor [Phycisphaerae bacterium RAS1]
MTPLVRSRRGFTLIELLVVVAIIALLISILIPSLNGAREQAKRAYCLANLKSIANAVQAYASEDEREHAVPIHWRHVVKGTGPFNLWRTTNWFAWGGVDGTKQFKITSSAGITFDENDAVGKDWAGKTRPLNKYVYKTLNPNDAKKPTIFKCPSDVGYRIFSTNNHTTAESRLTPCIEILGNSYRGSFYCYRNGGSAWPTNVMAMGPWGHRLSTMTTASEICQFGEPNFFYMISDETGSPSDADPIVVYGWHKKVLTENILFVDGSARTTQCGRTRPPTEIAAEMGIPDTAHIIRRGKGWRLDTYPTPGARISGARPQFWLPWTTQWPVAGAQDNMPDHPPVQ